MYSKLINIFKDESFRQGGLYSLYSFFNQGVGFILLILLANFLVPSQYGELSLFSTIVQLMSYIIGFSTTGYFYISFFRNNETPQSFKNDFSSICFLLVSSFLIIALILFIFRNWFSEKLSLSPLMLFWAICIPICSSINRMNLDYFRVKKQIGYYGILSCGFAVISAILTLCFVIWIIPTWEGRVYANLITDFGFALFAIIFFSRKKLFVLSFDAKRYKSLLLWGIPLIPHMASTWLRQGCDRYIINDHYSLDEVGLFSLALNLSNIIVIIGASFNSANSVDIYKILSSSLGNSEKKQSIYKKISQYSIFYLLAASVIVILGSICIPIILPKYSSCIPFFCLLAINAFLQCLFLIFSNFMYYYKETKYLMYTTVSASIVHLLLSLFLTRYSMYITCIIYIVSNSIVVYCVWKKSQKIIFKELCL